MRCWVIAMGAVGLFFASPLQAADPAPDTPAAAYTRSRKLTAKVTVAFDKTSFRDAFHAISDQLEEQKRGILLYRLTRSVPQFPSVTYTGKGVSVAEALDGMLKSLGCGYAIVSKPGDLGDGWIEVAAGDHRGYPPGVTDPDTPTASPEDEKAAQTRLDLAKKLQADGETERASIQLRFVAKKYAGTKAAAEARVILEKINK